MADPLDGVLVTPEEVEEIYPTELEPDQLYAFINTAHIFVDDIPASVGADRKKLIELWLSAHFLSLTDQQAKRENFAGDYSVEYVLGEMGEGFKATSYGQQALTLDPSGTLQRATAKRASMKIWSHYLE